MDLKKAYLVLACALVCVIALLYGVSPDWFSRTFLGIDNPGTSFAHILRAVMCLYIALGGFWLAAAFSPGLRNTAILTTMLFAGGLCAGRLVSFMIDGQPAPLLVFYAGLEFAILPIAYWLYRRPD